MWKILEIVIIFKFQCLVSQCLVSALRHYPEIQDIRIGEPQNDIIGQVTFRSDIIR